jgi:hypothetical protein
MKKPPLVEAALACWTIWSGHMPKGSASGSENGIIMTEEIYGTLLVIVSNIAGMKTIINGSIFV